MDFQVVSEVPPAGRGPGRPMRPEMATMLDEARRRQGEWLSRATDGLTNSQAMASFGRTFRRHGCEVACRTQDGTTRVFRRLP